MEKTINELLNDIMREDDYIEPKYYTQHRQEVEATLSAMVNSIIGDDVNVYLRTCPKGSMCDGSHCEYNHDEQELYFNRRKAEQRQRAIALGFDIETKGSDNDLL